ncbi:MAG: hypothetical protein ABW321_00500 [Polyangiales bacterium]
MLAAELEQKAPITTPVVLVRAHVFVTRATHHDGARNPLMPPCYRYGDEASRGNNHSHERVLLAPWPIVRLRTEAEATTVSSTLACTIVCGAAPAV